MAIASDNYSRAEKAKLLESVGKKVKVENRKRFYSRAPIRAAKTVSSLIEGAAFNSALRKGGAKAVKSREVGTKRLLQAVGAIPTAGRRSQGGGPGRPVGTYKYGMPIQQYKRLQNQRKALYQQYAQSQQEKLSQRGFTPQEIRQAQLSRSSQIQSQPMPQQYTEIESPADVASDELEFQRFLANNTVTPNTQRILDNLKRIQNKAQMDDINQQRVHRERKMVSQQGELLKARNLFGPDSSKINIFDDTNNPLKAENLFAKERQTNVFAPSGRPNILQTAAAGNSIHAFDADMNILNAPQVFSLESSQAHRLRFF